MSSFINPQFVIIDDDQLNVRIAQRQIEKAFPGAAIKTFVDPVEGLEYIQSDPGAGANNTTVVLLDIRMPRLSGWEFMQEFALLPEAVRNRFKICMCSSSLSNVDRQMAHDSPLVSRFIEKPIAQRELELLREELSN